MPARRREFAAYIRLRVNPRNFHQRTNPVPGCIGVRGKKVSTDVAAPFACRPENELFQDTQSWSG